MNKQRNQSTTGRITQGAAIAALYVALTMIVAPIAFGPVQFRISEALCVLPYFLPSAVPGVTIGCFLANLLCGAAPLDVVFGSLATLIGAVGSYYLGKKSKWLVCVPPILANTIITQLMRNGRDVGAGSLCFPKLPRGQESHSQNSLSSRDRSAAYAPSVPVLPPGGLPPVHMPEDPGLSPASERFQAGQGRVPPP